MTMAASASLRSLFDGGGAAAPSLLASLFEYKARDGPENQFASWLPYVAYAPKDKIFVNRDTLGFMVELMPQSGADERMVEILLSLYVTCPKGTGIQFSLFASPQVIEPLQRYGNLRVEDVDHADKAQERGRRARNSNLYRTLARRRIDHYLRGSHASLTQGYHYTVRDFKLMMSVCVPGGLDDVSRQEALITLREGMTSTLRSANFPNRLCNADDLINWCARFTNPHRLMVDRTALLNYDDGREIRDQIVDFDTQQEAKALGLVFTQAGHAGSVEARFYSIRSFPEQFALWQMSAVTGDLMQSALQYACPFLITMGVEILDPIAMKSVVTANHVRATQNAESSMAKIMPDVGKKLQDWTVAAQTLDQGGQIVSMYHQLALFTTPDRATAAEETARAIWRSRGFELNNDVYMHRQSLIASLPMTLSERFHADMKRMRRVTRKTVANAIHLAPLIGEWSGTNTPTLLLAGRRGQLMTLDLYERDRLVVPGGRFAGAPARSRALLREALPQGRRRFRGVRSAFEHLRKPV
jgi:conjugal transfer ATP-binding protein TraC